MLLEEICFPVTFKLKKVWKEIALLLASVRTTCVSMPTHWQAEKHENRLLAYARREQSQPLT